MRLKFEYLAAALLLFAASVPLPCMAESNELAILNRRVSGAEAELSSIRAELQRVKSELAEIASERSNLKSEEIQLRSQIKDTNDQIASVAQELEGLRNQISARRAAAPLRMKALYYLTRDQGGILKLSDSNRRGEDIYYLGKITAWDRNSLQRDIELSEREKESKARLEELASVHNSEQEKLSDRLAKLSDLSGRYDSKSKMLYSEEERVSSILTKLRAEALRLETALTSLLIKQKRKTENTLIQRGPNLPPYDGRGLFALKGSLQRPVEGTLVQSFGRKNAADFKDLVLNKGVEIRAAAGADVRSIAPGLVVHVGELPAYGRFVVIDHGKRYHSLYGKLETVKINVGEELDKGTLIGSIGAASSDEGNFYFEIRNAGQAVNPSAYFKDGL